MFKKFAYSLYKIFAKDVGQTVAVEVGKKGVKYADEKINEKYGKNKNPGQ